MEVGRNNMEKKEITEVWILSMWE
jgi:hypothetical protein